MAKTARKMAAIREALEEGKVYTLPEALEVLKNAGKERKLNESVEIAMNLGVDTRHADQNVRGMVTLPEGTGKDVRVAVFARDAKADEAREAGADIVGAEDLLEAIQGGTIAFDRCIATP
ncbi:MAG TPA: 50S ribosomal protein L1, partial [Rhodospirillaceae bacterium]|nr:50S ribosomal protein L1 [Rhodospirillaceae bacterium]